jgi:hypothetical protein
MFQRRYMRPAQRDDSAILELLPGGATSAQTNTGLTGTGHTLDADTMLLFRGNEALTFYDLTNSQGTTYGPATFSRVGGDADGVDGIIDGCRTLNGTSQHWIGNATAAARTAGIGAMSAEAWVRWNGSIGTVVTLAGDNFSDAENENFLFRMLINGSGKLNAYWEGAGGVDIATTQVAGTTVPTNTWAHIAVVRYLVSGVTWGVRFYINGALQDDIGGLAAAVDGSLANWQICRNGPGGGTAYFGGRLDDMRISKKARSTSEVLASYTAGMPVNVTGSLGEVVTCNRDSAGTSVNSAGTVVYHSVNGARVESRGLLVEPTRTNLVLQSETFDNATWLKVGNVVSAPSNLATNITAPDGTATAERYSLPVTTGGAAERTYLAQTVVTSAIAYSMSVWLKVASGTATVYLHTTADGITYHTTACALTTTWQRFKLENKTLSGASWYIQIGYDQRDGAQAPTAAMSLDLWGAQWEAGPYASSYIKTTSATRARAIELVSLPTTGWPTSRGEVSFTYTPLGATPGAQLFLLDTRTGNNGVYITRETNGTTVAATGSAAGSDAITTAALTWTPGTQYVMKLKWNASASTLYRDGVALGTFSNPRTPTAHGTASFCYQNTSNVAEGHISNLVVTD